MNNTRSATPAGNGNSAGRIHDQMMAIWYALWVAQSHLRLYHGPDFSINQLLEGVLGLFGEGKAPPQEANEAVRRVLGMTPKASDLADPAHTGVRLSAAGPRKSPVLNLRGDISRFEFNGLASVAGYSYTLNNHGRIGTDGGPVLHVNWQGDTLDITLEPDPDTARKPDYVPVSRETLDNIIGHIRTLTNVATLQDDAETLADLVRTNDRLTAKPRTAKSKDTSGHGSDHGRVAVYQDGRSVYTLDGSLIWAWDQPVRDHDMNAAAQARRAFLDRYGDVYYFPSR